MHPETIPYLQRFHAEYRKLRKSLKLIDLQAEKSTLGFVPMIELVNLDVGVHDAAIADMIQRNAQNRYTAIQKALPETY